MSSVTAGPPARPRSPDLVLSEIGAAPAGLTRAELARRTGMSPSAVSSIVARLLRRGLLVELSPEPGPGRGRPSARLRPARSSGMVAGLDFGHNHISAAIADSEGIVRAQARAELEVDVDAAVSVRRGVELLGQLAEMVPEPLLAVAAGVPGPFNSETGLVHSTTILSGWTGSRPAELLGAALRQEVVVENDAYLGAYAEAQHGAGRRHRAFLYVKVSHGVGAALVLDGVPYRGSIGVAGEIGHTVIPGRTERCRCGERGCLEAVVSATNVQRLLEDAHPHLRGAGAHELFALDEPAAREILHEAGYTLGSALAGLANLVNPSAVVLGGELGSVSAELAAGVTRGIRRHAQPAITEFLTVERSYAGPSNELAGALALASATAHARLSARR